MKKLLLVSIVILSMLLPLSAQAFAITPEAGEAIVMTKEPAYTDLAADWYRVPAEKYGYPEIFARGNLFEPGWAITRMEFARMIHKALDISINYFAATNIGDFYSDVDSNMAGADELYDLVVANIIDTKDCFSPDQPLSREEMIHFIMNALNYVTDGNYAVILMMPAPFDDDASISDEYRNDVMQSVLLKLINGRGNNRLYPKEYSTRAEAVVVVDRLIDLTCDLVQNVEISSSVSEIDGSLQMLLVIENNCDKTVTINHSSGQQFDFVVLNDRGESIYTWSADKNFIAALTNTRIESGGKVEFSAEIEKETYDQIKDEIAYIKAFIVGSSDDFYTEANGYVAERTLSC